MKKIPYNGWVDWRYLELNSRIRKGIRFPTRERMLIRDALKRIGLRYKELVPFYNPTYNGHRNQYDGSIQWVDFLVYKNRMFAIQFDVKNRHGGVLQRKKDVHKTRKQYLEQRGIPVLIVDRYWTGQEYEMRIRMFLRQLEKQ